MNSISSFLGRCETIVAVTVVIAGADVVSLVENMLINDHARDSTTTNAMPTNSSRILIITYNFGNDR